MTETERHRTKGAPLRALLVIMVVWVMGRIIWESLSPLKTVPVIAAQANYPSVNQRATENSDKQPSLYISPASGGSRTQASIGRFPVRQAAFPSYVRPLPHNQVNGHLIVRRTLDDVGDIVSRVPPKTRSYVVGSATVAAEPVSLKAKGKTALSLKQSESPFSGYFWVFVRQDSARAARFILPSSQFPSSQYGASQAGAILRYRLSGDSRRNLSLFARASTALSFSGEEELAVGAKVKPLPKIPVSLFVEQRFGNQHNRNRGVALYLAGGTGPDRVLGGPEVETYGQAGYLFDHEDTYFFDGSATAQTKLVRKNRKALSLGAGLWAGGQKGAARVDVGPRMDIRFPVGDLSARLLVDWRQRIAGDARPGSGVAVSLSAGF